MIKGVFLGFALFFSIVQWGVSLDQPTDSTLSNAFRVEILSEGTQQEMIGISYHKDAPISLDDLRVVHIQYINFDGVSESGEIVVHEEIALEVLEIFKELYGAKYPLHLVKPIESFNGDDALSMAANNTSGFNHRQVAGTKRLSLHAYGLAIDINPIQNPYVSQKGVEPMAGEAFLNRSTSEMGMITDGDPCYTAFVSRGWEWGGHWKTVKDYQHFQKKVPEVINP